MPRSHSGAGGRCLSALRLYAPWLLLGLIAGLLPGGGHAGQEGGPDARQTFKSAPPAPNQGLDLSIGGVNLADKGGGADDGDALLSRPGAPRVNWSRGLRDDWQLNPVLLNRRQAGQPVYEDEDLTRETFGIELRRKF